MLLNNFLLNRNEQHTSHKLYLWHGSFAGNLILVSVVLIWLATFCVVDSFGSSEPNHSATTRHMAPSKLRISPNCMLPLLFYGIPFVWLFYNVNLIIHFEFTQGTVFVPVLYGPSDSVVSSLHCLSCFSDRLSRSTFVGPIHKMATSYLLQVKPQVTVWICQPA